MKGSNWGGRSMRVLVSGGAGYIGSHTCVELLEAGYQLMVIDNLSNSKEEALRRVAHITGREPAFLCADLRDQTALQTLFRDHDFDAVIHFAGLKAVGESTQIPLVLVLPLAVSSCRERFAEMGPKSGNHGLVDF
jgi:UDP-glucose 4-epimerase